MTEKQGLKTEERFIYVRDDGRTVTGLATHAAATEEAAKLAVDLKEPEWRVRVRLRSRTESFDVVVKRRKAVTL